MPIRERELLLILAAVQFVNVLDFMMVMPLGPDVARSIGIPASQLGIVGASYTAAAAVTGVIGAFFLDRFDRRWALAVALAGLAVGTAAGGLATGMPSLVAARVLAGAFGGPATSLALAIIGDVVPPERRGRAIGLVMGAFAVASVLGVPVGLELARLGSWRTPFFVVAALGAVIAIGAAARLPALTGHRGGGAAPGGLLAAVRPREARLMLASTALVMFAGFAIIPNLSAYLQFNLGYPRAQLGLLYLVGGAVSFFVLRIAGRLVDRAGATVVASGATVSYGLIMIALFIAPITAIPVLAMFVLFMATNSARMVPMQTLATRVPSPQHRAGFMSAQSAVQHLASSAGAAGSTLLLTELPDHRLTGMATLGWVALALSALVPWLLWRTEQLVVARGSPRATR